MTLLKIVRHRQVPSLLAEGSANMRPTKARSAATPWTHHPKAEGTAVGKVAEAVARATTKAVAVAEDAAKDAGLLVVGDADSPRMAARSVDDQATQLEGAGQPASRTLRCKS